MPLELSSPLVSTPRISMDSPPPYPPPRLPWEVIERVIDLSHGRPKTLKSLTLTCRQLLPRTRLAIFSRVRFKSRDHVFAFVDFLRKNPHLMPVVRSIVVRPADLAPVPLLRILPSLSEIWFCVSFSPNIFDMKVDDEEGERERLPGLRFQRLWHDTSRSSRGVEKFPTLHQSNYPCFQRLGTHIRTLHLSTFRFDNLVSFARAIMTFPNIVHLLCDDVEIIEEAPSNGEGPLSLPDAVKRQLSRRMKLTALTVDYSCVISDHSPRLATNLGRLLLDSSNSPVPSTIERLTLRWKVDHGFLSIYHCDWSSLRSLTLQLSLMSNTDHHYHGSANEDEVTKFLEGFPKRPTLTDVTLEWQMQDIATLCRRLSSYQAQERYKKLDLAMLPFSQPRFICAFTLPLPINSGSFWLGELRKHLPMLSQRDGVMFHSQFEGEAVRHGDVIQVLASSPDSKWVASASWDSTVILWDADNGTIGRQWVAHGYKSVNTLAFSPDSQYLVSGGDDGSAAIWDLGQGARKITTLLQDHAEPVSGCAWSPGGETIATASQCTGAVRLWDARTFRQRAIYRCHMGLSRLSFSPNGLWLVCASNKDGCSITRDAALDTLDQFFGGDCPLPPSKLVPPRPVAIAASDDTGVRLAIAPKGRHPRINVVDVKTTALWKVEKNGRQLEARHISFSPDRRLVLAVVGRTSYVWDASTGSDLFQLEGHGGDIPKATFSPCGKYIASVSSGGIGVAVQLRRTSDGSRLATLPEHRGSVEHVVFSPDGKTLATADDDGRVIIRRMRDILPPIHCTPDDAALALLSPVPVVDPTPRPRPLPNRHTGVSPDEETGPRGLHRTVERGEVSELEERRTERDAAGSGRPAWLQQRIAGTPIPEVVPIALAELLERMARPMSPAPAPAPTEREAPASRGRPPAREAREDAARARARAQAQAARTSGWLTRYPARS